MSKTTQTECGFTLVEVLMVIGLMAILSVGSVILISSTLDESRFKTTLTQMQEIREALVGKWEPGRLGDAPAIALHPSWAPQASDLIGLWHLDESTPPALEDASGTGHPGTSLGTVILNSPGKIKTALKTSGAGAWSAVLDLSSVTTLTIAGWFNYTGCANPTACILWEYTPDSNASFGFYTALNDTSDPSFPAGSFTFSHRHSGGRMVHYAANPSLGWHHLAVVIDRSNAGANTISAYLDGSALLLTASALNQSAGDSFGNSSLYFLARAGTSLSLSSSMDELAVWKSALTALEIKTIYDKQFSHFAPAVRKYFGYLGDIGALPNLAQGIAALNANPGLPVWSMNPSQRIGMGWNGPYLNQNGLGIDYSKDAWGTAYVYDPSLSPPELKSLGADRAIGGTGLNQDISLSISPAILTSTLHGVILNKGGEWSGNAEIELNRPDGNGISIQSRVTTLPAAKGAFSFSNVPQGVRSATVYIPSKAAAVITQGPFIFSADRADTPITLQVNF